MTGTDGNGGRTNGTGGKGVGEPGGLGGANPAGICR